MNLVGFPEVSLLTAWTSATRGAHHGHREVTLMSKTTPGQTLAALPFMVAGRGSNSPTPLLYPPPIPWASSEGGQEPPRPIRPSSRIPPRPLPCHPPALLNPRLRQAALSSGAGTFNNADLL